MTLSTFWLTVGAQYTLLPHATCQELGLEPKRRQAFMLVDGTQIERDVSECLLVLPQGGHTPVVLGEPGDDRPILGVVTLEQFGLMLNPINRKLQPMRMMM
ncbi:MAG: hypothetical protein R3C02_19080 [Planctomycetaceae bacterium]